MIQSSICLCTRDVEGARILGQIEKAMRYWCLAVVASYRYSTEHTYVLCPEEKTTLQYLVCTHPVHFLATVTKRVA
jgi:hypothetical protein